MRNPYDHLTVNVSKFISSKFHRKISAFLGMIADNAEVLQKSTENERFCSS